jgi:hypothetical protein
MKKFSVKRAMEYVTIHMGRPCTMLDWRRFRINNQDVLVLFFSLKHAEIPRTYRMQVFIDGEPAGGFIL